MISFWGKIIGQQFLAALQMVENAIRACPLEVWAAPGQTIQWKQNEPVGFWYVAFHTLFFLDYHLSESPIEFTPPKPFTLDELDPSGVLPERVYSQDELLRYVEHCRRKLLFAIANMTEAHAMERCAFPEHDLSVAELLLYDMRHVQHHAAQLNLLLRLAGLTTPKWIRQSH